MPRRLQKRGMWRRKLVLLWTERTLTRSASFPSPSRAGTSQAAPSTSVSGGRGAAQRRTARVTTWRAGGATAQTPVLSTSQPGSVSPSPAPSQVSSVSSLSSTGISFTGAALLERTTTGVPPSWTITTSWRGRTGAGASPAAGRRRRRRRGCRVLDPLRRRQKLGG